MRNRNVAVRDCFDILSNSNSFTVSLDKNGHFFQRDAISKTKVLEVFEFDNNLHSLTLKTRFTMSIGQP